MDQHAQRAPLPEKELDAIARIVARVSSEPLVRSYAATESIRGSSERDSSNLEKQSRYFPSRTFLNIAPSSLLTRVRTESNASRTLSPSGSRTSPHSFITLVGISPLCGPTAVSHSERPTGQCTRLARSRCSRADTLRTQVHETDKISSQPAHSFSDPASWLSRYRRPVIHRRRCVCYQGLQERRDDRAERGNCCAHRRGR